jgi:hypothetical protein
MDDLMDAGMVEEAELRAEPGPRLTVNAQLSTG